MNYSNTLTYEQAKQNIEWMINYYSRDLLEDPRIAAMSLDDIEILYLMDQEMVGFYCGELLVLDAKKILNLI